MVQNTIIARFQAEDGQNESPPMNLPVDITNEQLELVINQLLNNEEKLPYTFFVEDTEIGKSLKDDVIDGLKKTTEDHLVIVYKPQAIFRVRAVTRCSSTLSGHGDAILSVVFSPDGTRAASGSGDTTVRFWDLTTETPLRSGNVHKNWVLCVAFSPDGKYVASGGMDNLVVIWDAKTGQPIGAPLRGHGKWITSLSWEPFHQDTTCTRLASSSKDATVRIWNIHTKRCEIVLSQHTDTITCVKWGGEGLIYTASRDRSIKVWDAKDGKLCRSLDGHGHWVNTMALNTDYALKLGPFDHKQKRAKDDEEARKEAHDRYLEAKGNQPERLITGSDDFTMFLWEPSTQKKPLARLTGHQQLVNQVAFSPDGRYIASASFDKSVKVWDGRTGKFIVNFRSHVSPVYQVAFSADSRLLVSCSKDSTLKLWDLRSKKLKCDLPGHADEVYSVDWSPNGESCVMSGGKDRMVKFWRQ